MTEWLLAQLFDRVRTAMGVRNCADGCHLLQVLVACRLCHICYDLAQRVDVGFRFCLGSRQELLSHSLQRRSSVHGSVFELRQGVAPDRSGGGTSSVSDTFEDSEALVDMVDGTDCQRIVAMASLTGIVRFVICLVDVSILVAVAFSLADALEVAAGMEEEAVATYHGARRKPLHSLIDKKKKSAAPLIIGKLPIFIFTYSLIANKSSIVTSLCTMLWCKPSATPYVVTKVMTKESFVLVELWNSSIRCRNSCS